MKDNFERTALIAAASRGHDKCVKILAKTKELEMKNKKGNTALMRAMKYDHDKCVEILKDAMKKKKKK